MKQVVHAACPHDCPDACGVLITVQDGRATKIQGDPEHPVTRGFLCAKVAKYLDRVYSPDRVLYPMRRIGPKGPGAGQRSFAPHDRVKDPLPHSQNPQNQNPHGQDLRETWERISWDEALDEIATRSEEHTSELQSLRHLVCRL